MNSLPFLRKYSIFLYSIFLVIAVTTAIFWNSYYSLEKFQTSADQLILSKAGLAEEVFQTLSSGYLDTPEYLQEKIDRLKQNESDISAIAVYVRTEDGEGFRSIASTDHQDIGTIQSEFPYHLAWNEEAGSAFVSNDGGKRYWNILKRISDSGAKKGLVFFQLSLEQNDAFVRSAIVRSYLVAFVTLLFVLLLLLNHLRFSRYAIRAMHLEEVDKMKDDFISMASHELKSPIAILRGYTDILKGENSPKESREYIGKMESTLERLATLVDDLLNVSRLEQNRLPINVTTMDVTSVLKPLVADYSIMAREKGLELLFSDVVVPRVSADPERVKQILVNLLSNAVKYTKKGKIEVMVKENGDRVTVTVADTGLGISAENLEKLFTKFYRVKTKETEEISGTGLGLWIAREIARKMGGDLTVESIEGVGSHFSLHLKQG